MFIGGLARVADAKCVVITFSYPNSSPHSMIHVTRYGVLKKHPTHASVHAELANALPNVRCDLVGGQLGFSPSR